MRENHASRGAAAKATQSHREPSASHLLGRGLRPPCDPQATCYEVMSSVAKPSRRFFLKSCLCLFFFPALAEFRNVLPALSNGSSGCSSCYPCTALCGTAPVDTCGHSQETGAPNLEPGPLPAPVAFEARAVSSPLGRPSSSRFHSGLSCIPGLEVQAGFLYTLRQ